MSGVPNTVAVIGAGWAGCAAAVNLVRNGINVTFYESSRMPGGRARRVDIENMILDNGQHILLGAYTETLRLMQTVGVDMQTALMRLPLQMRYPTDSGGMDFVAPRLPAPLHMLVALFRATGLAKEDKLALARFSTTARWMGWQLHEDCSVTELLERFDQTERLTKLMWRPLCIAALNTPPEHASAKIFLNVLRDSLGARRAASDMLIPRVDLTALLPQRAVDYVERHGGKMKLGTTVKRIVRSDVQWQLETTDGESGDGQDSRFDAVIVATQPNHAARLLQGLADITLQTDLEFKYEPITTCYLQYSASIRLQQPFFALIDDPANDDWGQFVFDRGILDPAAAGLLAVVVSASSNAITPGHDVLAAAITRQLARTFGWQELAIPRWVKVISEKRATFSCSPGLHRPSNQTGLDRLLLAGDYTAGDYPATIESAVRSGLSAAKQLLG